MIVFDILGTRIEFENDLQFFVKRLFEFEETRDSIIVDANRSIGNNKILDALKDTDTAFNESVRQVIAELSKYGVYDRIVDDFIGGNKGYTNFLSSINNYLDRVNRIVQEHNSTAESYIAKEERYAKSQISGLDFGIITNDILSMWIYDSMNKSKIRKETEKARNEFDSAVSRISSITQQYIESDTTRLRTEEFIPAVDNAITEFYSILFMQYMGLMSQYGQFNISSIKDIDEKRAVLLLNNLEIVESPENLITNSIKLCPYRVPAYLMAENLGLLNDSMIQCCEYFFQNRKLEKAILDTYIDDKENSRGELNIIKTYDGLRNHLDTLSKLSGMKKEEYFKNIVQDSINIKEKRLKNFVNDLCEKSDNYRRYWIDSNAKGTTKEEVKGKILSKLGSIVSESEYQCLIEYAEYNIVSCLSEKIDTENASFNGLEKYILDNTDAVIDVYVTEKRQELQKNIERKRRDKERADKVLEQEKSAKKLTKVGVIVAVIALVIGFVVWKLPTWKNNYNDTKTYKEAVKQYGEILEGVYYGANKSDIDSKYIITKDEKKKGETYYHTYYSCEFLGISGILDVFYQKKYGNDDSAMEVVCFGWSCENADIDKEWFMTCCDQYMIRKQRVHRKEIGDAYEYYYDGEYTSGYVMLNNNRIWISVTEN